MADAGTRPAERPLSRLGDPRLIGWPLVVTSFLVFLVDGFPFLGGSELDGSSLQRAGQVLRAAAAAHLAIIAVLLVARFTWLASRFAQRHPSVWVASFFVAVLVGDGVFQSSIAASSDGQYVAASLVDTVLYKTIALVLLAVLIGRLADYRRRIHELEHTRRSIVAARDQAMAVEQQERSFVADTIRATLATARLAIGDGDVHRAIDVLRSANVERVRPLSHDLAATRTDFAPTPIAPLPSPSWRATLPSVFDAPLIAPRMMAGVMVLLGFRQTVTSESEVRPSSTAAGTTVTFDLQPFLEAVSVLAVIFVATYVTARWAAQVIERRQASWSSRRRAGATAIGIVVIAAVTLAAVASAFQLPWFPDPPDVGWWAPLLTLVPLSAIAVLHGLGRTITARREAAVHQRAEANRELRWELASINERLWHHRRTLAYDVHGQVQATINAAVHRLQGLLATSAAADERREVLESVDGALAQCAAGLDYTRRKTVDVMAALDDVVALWRGVCELEVAVSGDAQEQLVCDAAAADAVVAIVGEACANAVRHGAATQFTVMADLVDPQTLRLTLADDGGGGSSGQAGTAGNDGRADRASTLDATPPPGLGSRLLDEVTVAWSRQSSATGTKLIADIPVQPLRDR